MLLCNNTAKLKLGNELFANIELVIELVTQMVSNTELVTGLVTNIEHIGRLARMSVLDTEVDGLNPGSSMLFP